MGLLLLDVFKGIEMSDTCPNCGSAVDRHSAYQRTSHTTKFICGGLLIEHASRKNLVGTDACNLIRSLREELAAARDAERDRIANWLRTCNPSKTAPHLAGCFGSADKLADAIRNNEHRKRDIDGGHDE